MGRKIVIVDDDQDLVLDLTARLKDPAKTGETAGRTARNPPQHLCAPACFGQSACKRRSFNVELDRECFTITTAIPYPRRESPLVRGNNTLPRAFARTVHHW